MQPFLFEQAVAAIVLRDKRFSPDAYYFLKDALDFTVKRIADAPGGRPGHVSGQQLLEGFRDLALQEFGPMAATLAGVWGLSRCQDVGDMVFHLIDEQVFSKQDSDSSGDFRGEWDLLEVLREPFLPSRLREGRAAESESQPSRSISED